LQNNSRFWESLQRVLLPALLLNGTAPLELLPGTAEELLGNRAELLLGTVEFELGTAEELL
jgi:hypothetical protein